MDKTLQQNFKYVLFQGAFYLLTPYLDSNDQKQS